MEPTRQSLILKIRDPGDAQAWSEFDTLYQPIMRRYARSQGLNPNEIDDVVQDCLLKIQRAIRNFEHDGRVGGFRAWLRRSVINQIYTLWQKKRGHVNADTAHFERPDSQAEDPEAAFAEIERQELLRHCVTQLEPRLEPETFQIFKKMAFEGWSGQQIMDEFGITSRTRVDQIKFRVTRMLRDMMLEQFDEQI